jgi:hypothetical protein
MTKLSIGDCSENGQITIIDEDRLCYLVKSNSKGAVGLRTISKTLLQEFVTFIEQHPEVPTNDIRFKISGQSDIDKYEYGYGATLVTMAKMILGREKILRSVKSANRCPDSPLQCIFYGAPGTGKSFIIKKQTEGRNIIRTTFHPDSDYASFVGCYKPTMKRYDKIYSVNELKGKLKEIKESGVTYPCHKFAAQYWMSLQDLKPDDTKSILSACGFTDSMNVEISKGIAIGQEFLNNAEDGKIIYSFTPQAFINAYVQAWKFYAQAGKEGQPKEQYLIIEEINRGNCAQIFGDLFQLLDRNKEGFSEYYISPDEDIQQYLKTAFNDMAYLNAPSLYGMTSEDIALKIRRGEILVIPNNLYIWATMNTSDQSLFPIDSAFKRRWDWEYIKITEGKNENTGNPLNWKILVEDNEEDRVRLYDWWKFLQIMNKKIYGATMSADKQLGYFFAKPDEQHFHGKKIGVIKNNNQFEELTETDRDYDIITAKTFVNKVLFYLWTDIFKDYGYDEIKSLMKKDSDEITFSDFFGETSNEINNESVYMFLDNVMKDEETLCEIAERTVPKETTTSNTNQWFKPDSAIFKITKYPQDEKGLYERARQAWHMSDKRAKEIKYFYAYASPVQKIVACYMITNRTLETYDNGKHRHIFEGTPINDDPMIGEPVETIAHARGGVIFYPENINK